MAHKITNAKKIQKKSRSHQITQTGDNSYTVTSGSSGKQYYVTTSDFGGTCTCKWSQYRPASDIRSGCSHVVSVYNHIEENQGRKVSAWTSQAQASRQHRPTRKIGDGVILTSRVASNA